MNWSCTYLLGEMDCWKVFEASRLRNPEACLAVQGASKFTSDVSLKPQLTNHPAYMKGHSLHRNSNLSILFGDPFCFI